MNHLELRLQGDGAIPELADAEVIHLGNEARIIIAALENGTSSGQPSVALAFDISEQVSLGGGDAKPVWVLAETTLRLLLSAADALRARFTRSGEQARQRVIDRGMGAVEAGASPADAYRVAMLAAVDDIEPDFSRIDSALHGLDLDAGSFWLGVQCVAHAMSGVDALAAINEFPEAYLAAVEKAREVTR